MVKKHSIETAHRSNGKKNSGAPNGKFLEKDLKTTTKRE